MNNCNCCFTDYIAKCETALTVMTMLVPAAEYRWVITDKRSGNMYEGDAVVDAEGHIVIPVTELPAGMLNQYAGEFSLQLFPVEEESCGPIRFKLAGEYDCIDFNVTGGTFAKSNLGCEVVTV